MSEGQSLHAAASGGDVARVRSILTTPRSCSAFPLLSRGWGSGQKAASASSGAVDVNDLDASGCTPLQKAAADGHEEIVRLLLAHGADVNRKDSVHGNTALHEAAWKGYSRTVGLLAAAGAQLGPQNNGGFAPLHLCCQNGHNQSCRELLLAGCDPDIQNNYGDTPLHTSARYGHAGVTRILISAQCRVSDQNKNGDTALHIASAMGRRKLTRILLEAGCDKHLRNKQGETAKDIATRKDLNEIIHIINTTKSLKKKNEKTSEKKQRVKLDSPNPKEPNGTGKNKEHKEHKDKKKAKVRFEASGRQWSPYGCHYYPDPKSFPKPNLDSLPDEPLKKGEQYYLDLAGNIRKGPVGVGYTCYCAPFFKHMEERLDRDKQELKAHIDKAHEKLNHKVTNLERKTQGQISELTRCVAAERALCDKRHQHLEQWLLRSRFGRQSERVKKVEHSPLGSEGDALPIIRSKSLELLDDLTSGLLESRIEEPNSKHNSRSMEVLDGHSDEASASKLTPSKSTSRILEKFKRNLRNSAEKMHTVQILPENFNFKSQVLRETANARGLFGNYSEENSKSQKYLVTVDHHADDEPRKSVSDMIAQLQQKNDPKSKDNTPKSDISVYNNSIINNQTEMQIPINLNSEIRFHDGDDHSESSDDEDRPIRRQVEPGLMLDSNITFPNYENLTSQITYHTVVSPTYNQGLTNGNYNDFPPDYINGNTEYIPRTRNGVYDPGSHDLNPLTYQFDRPTSDIHNIHVDPLENYHDIKNTGLYVLDSHEALVNSDSKQFIFNEPVLQVNTMLESDIHLPPPQRLERNRRHVDLHLLERDVHNRIANLQLVDRDLKKDVALIEHNDSGYSTKVYGSSQGNSPSLSGQLEVDSSNIKPTVPRTNNATIGASSLV